jgi:plastocyanin domain-containing protein
MRTPLFFALVVLGLSSCKKEEAAPVPAPVAAAPVKAPEPAPKPAAPAALEKGKIALEVTGDGFVPSNVTVKAGEPVTLVVTRKTDETCATELLIEGTDIKTALPLNQAVEIAWTPTKPGKVKFGCAMDMMVGGLLLVE